MRWVCCAVLAAVCLPPLAAAAEDGDQAVESGRKALGRFWNANWYDSARDDVKPITVREPRPPRRSSDLPWFRGLGRTLQILALVLLVAVLALIAWLIFYTFYQRDRRRVPLDDDEADEDRQAAVDRVEQLPVKLRRPRGNLLDEARYQYEQGNFSEAIVYLYSYYLVQLDKQQRIRLARGKTNRQYLRELSGDTPLRNLMENAMILFEDAFFGKRRISRTEFEYCWNRLDDFHQWNAPGPR